MPMPKQFMINVKIFFAKVQCAYDVTPFQRAISD